MAAETRSGPMPWRSFLSHYGIYCLPVVVLSYVALESYQIDYRAFYLAGKSVLLGLDPYLNYVGLRPEFYAPINAEDAAFSAFRYPPLAALLFAPLALFPYGVSKLVFTLLMLALVVVSAGQIVRRFRGQWPGESLLFALLSFPVLAVVERGQVDPLMVVLVLAGFTVAGERRRQGVAGFSLALAGVLKIFPFVVLIEVLARRQWRLFMATCFWGLLLFSAPWLLFGSKVYGHFWQRTFPEQLGVIVNPIARDLHGQGIDLGRLARAIDGNGLIISHDFTNGFMNPLLRDSTAGALLVGLLLALLLEWLGRRANPELRFYAFLNVINLFNPLAWIMGLVWYLPLFFYLYPRLTRLGRGLLLAPLFLPPFLNANAALAYVIALVFVRASGSSGWGAGLVAPVVDALP